MTAASTITVTVSRVTDFAALETRWRELETRSDPSFFQSWTWTGCLVEERFPNPVLVEARQADRTVALGLFNQRGRSLYLGESGDPALDTIYIEHNGILVEAGQPPSVQTACLSAALRGTGPGTSNGTGLGRFRLVLSGVNGAAAAEAARSGYVRHLRATAAPYVDMERHGQDFLDRRSANTRQQLRRSDRSYAARGALMIKRAETPVETETFMDGLRALHQDWWVARGRPGAFANPFFIRFHRALLARGMDRNEIDLFRVAAGADTIGFLYNFRFRGNSLAYQSGFDYANATRHEKPGLTCHHQAIRYAAGWGAARYDFLAGDDRYKQSLSDDCETLHWIEAGGPFSPRLRLLSARDQLSSYLARVRPSTAG